MSVGFVQGRGVNTDMLHCIWESGTDGTHSRALVWACERGLWCNEPTCCAGTGGGALHKKLEPSSTVKCRPFSKPSLDKGRAGRGGRQNQMDGCRSLRPGKSVGEWVLGL